MQRLLGYSEQVDEARRTGSKTKANQMSVRLELQADYLAGVWAHMRSGDSSISMRRTSSLRKTRLSTSAMTCFRNASRGRVTPDSFTHGSAKQRQRWFMEGFKTGDVNAAPTVVRLAV